MTKRLLLILLTLTVSLYGCKEKKPDPISGFELLTGKWILVAHERVENGEKVWKEVDSEIILEFRFDGVLLNSEGLPSCCTPDVYKVNGEKIQIVPLAPLKENPICYLIDCIGCAMLTINIEEPGRMIMGCDGGGARSKYERQ